MKIQSSYSGQSSKKIKLGPRQRKLFYLFFSGIWVTGVIWLYFHYFHVIKSELGPEKHPLEIISLQAHAAFSIGFLVMIGSLMNHLQKGWEVNRNRASGVLVIILLFILIFTSWCLYYLSNEDFRVFVSLVHWVLGLVLPVFLCFHIYQGRLRKIKQRHGTIQKHSTRQTVDAQSICRL